MAYLVAFLSGACLMSLEMAGSRILAPYFGSSIVVWGSLVGTILVALTVGYYLGGLMADRWPHFHALGWALLGASGFTALVPVLSSRLLPVLLAPGSSSRISPLLACTCLFFVPSVLMGMVSPWLVRLSVSSVERAGRSTGLLYAVSNAGSIAGTFFTSFFWISWRGTSSIVTSLSLILLVCALLTAMPSLLRAPPGRKPVGFVALVATVFLLVFLSSGTVRVPGENVIYESRSLYHHIYVVDAGEVRLLKFDRSIQGGMSKENPFESAFPYPDYFHLALLFNPRPRKLLVVGLGAGLAPRRFWRDYPDLQVEVVELDPEVVKVCSRYFGLPSDSRFRVEVNDGRMFLRDSASTYDIILLDAYFADAIPFHLTTVEFYKIVRERLAPGGVVAYNMIGAIQGPRSRLFRSMLRTFTAVFPETYVFPVNPGAGDEESLRNIVVIGRVSPAGWSGERLSAEEIDARARSLAETVVTVPGFVDMARGLYRGEIPLDDVPILTDDYAPVDSLLHLY